MKIDLIAGARPNFIKISPIINAIKKAKLEGANIQFRLIHTGQHYDHNMSESFFKQLDIPLPDINFNAGGGTQSQQTSKIMLKYEELLFKGKPEFCLLVGDVTSTLACSIVAKKMGLKVVHVEAGIRSGDMGMPEEINRIVTDSLTDYFFTTSEVASKNLIKSGFEKEKIFFVGNTMIDTLLKNKLRFKKPEFWQTLKLKKKDYFILTLHRPSNVDNKNILRSYLKEIILHANNLPILFPVHPRTEKMVNSLKINLNNLVILKPMSYLEFNYLVKNSLAVITDSGGITEETTVMKIPCITIRNSTERPETVTLGTNELIGTDKKNIGPYIKLVLSGKWKNSTIPPMWDGFTAQRIISKLLSL